MKTIIALALSTLALVACGTKAGNNSTVASADASGNSASLPVVMTCSADGTDASTSFTISTNETGLILDAQGKLVVAGHEAHFIEQAGYTCENDLEQPQFVGAPDYLWACHANNGGNEIQITSKNGVITATVGTDGSDSMTCQAAQ